MRYSWRKASQVTMRHPTYEEAEAARKNLAATKTGEQKVTASGQLDVNVRAPASRRVAARGLFKKTNINWQVQMSQAAKSDNTDQAGDEIMAP